MCVCFDSYFVASFLLMSGSFSIGIFLCTKNVFQCVPFVPRSMNENSWWSFFCASWRSQFPHSNRRFISTAGSSGLRDANQSRSRPYSKLRLRRTILVRLLNRWLQFRDFKMVVTPKHTCKIKFARDWMLFHLKSILHQQQ